MHSACVQSYTSRSTPLPHLESKIRRGKPASARAAAPQKTKRGLRSPSACRLPLAAAGNCIFGARCEILSPAQVFSRLTQKRKLRYFVRGKRACGAKSQARLRRIKRASGPRQKSRCVAKRFRLTQAVQRKYRFRFSDFDRMQRFLHA